MRCKLHAILNLGWISLQYFNVELTNMLQLLYLVVAVSIMLLSLITEALTYQFSCTSAATDSSGATVSNHGAVTMKNKWLIVCCHAHRSELQVAICTLIQAGRRRNTLSREKWLNKCNTKTATQRDHAWGKQHQFYYFFFIYLSGKLVDLEDI